MAEIIAGRNPVIEALKAGRPLSKILLERTAKTQGTVAEIEQLARARAISIELVDGQVLDRLSSIHHGVIAYAATKGYVTLDELLSISQKKNEPALFVVLDGIEDPQNLGAILRTADAAGVHGVVVRERRAVGLTPAVARASAGAVEYVPVAQVTNIAQTIEAMKKKNIWIVGIDMSGKAEYTEVDFRMPSAIVVGGEGKGLSDLVRKKCDWLARIPMKGKIASLNASVATAVVLYEALRQRSLPVKKEPSR